MSSLSSDISIAGCLSLTEDLLATLELNPKLAPGGRGVPMWVIRGDGLPNTGGGNVTGREVSRAGSGCNLAGNGGRPVIRKLS